MFCQRCGRKLEDGEICNCTVEVNDNNIQESQQVNSSIPDSQALVEGAKNAAAAIKNNPIVSEVITTMKGSLVSPIKQIATNSARTDILWIILFLLESAMISFSITTMFKRSIFALVQTIEKNYDWVYSDVVEELKEMGVTTIKLFGIHFVWALIFIVCEAIILTALMAICKKKCSFAPIANAVATATMPSAIIMVFAAILSVIYVPLSFLAALAAIISSILLGYVAIQKVDKFTSSPFWFYVVAYVIVFVGGILLEKTLLGEFGEELLGSVI